MHEIQNVLTITGKQPTIAVASKLPLPMYVRVKELVERRGTNMCAWLLGLCEKELAQEEAQRANATQ